MDNYIVFGWRFTKNVELQCVSSPRSARLAMLRGAPTRRASAIFCARDFLALRASYKSKSVRTVNDWDNYMTLAIYL